MSLSLTSSRTAIAVGTTSSFLAHGGEEPYLYTVQASGAGGSINVNTGLYTAPQVLDQDPAKNVDVIRATANDGAFITAPILVTTPLGLFCDVLKKELNLANDRVYLWDQKLNQPKDSGLYIAVAVLSGKPFGNTNKVLSGGPEPGDGMVSHQSVNMLATLQVSIISRGPEARDRKEEIIMALESDYARAQQEANSFYIGKLPAGSQFVNLSSVDGAAIPYRFDISVNIQYFVRKIKAINYFSDFAPVSVTTDS